MASMGRYSGGRRVTVSPSQIDNRTPPLVLPPTPLKPKLATVFDQDTPPAPPQTAPNVATAAALLAFDAMGVCPKCKTPMTYATIASGEKVYYCDACRVTIPQSLENTNAQAT